MGTASRQHAIAVRTRGLSCERVRCEHCELVRFLVDNVEFSPDASSTAALALPPLRERGCYEVTTGP